MNHSTRTLEALKTTDALQDVTRELWLEMTNAYGGALYAVDLVANAAVKRSISQAHGFRLLVEAGNLVCARSLLRLQLDTAIRFYAISLAESSHDFCRNIIKGIQISRMKDRDGNRLTDRYLVTKLGEQHEWMPRVYDELSGYIHFSVRHFYPIVESINQESREMSLVIGPTDENYPEFSWWEAVECFNESTKVFLDYLRAWIDTKSNPDAPRDR